MAIFKGFILNKGCQQTGIRRGNVGKGSRIVELIGLMDGKRISNVGKGSRIVELIGPMNGERISNVGKGSRIVELIGPMDGERVPNVGQANHMPDLFVAGGVRIPATTFKGDFLQNQYIPEEEIRNQALPRKEPLESPWKKRTYSKNNLN
ncbi:hypothetical protein [Bacillus toyonensis]|uniref:hypothetical protein n=1 Tax=Bacillus toyonensis TaxID=155322 RepID=UPI000279C611|nr:hypothetical protein [Bacillus toyonensis]EJR57245.1 hypothetical protein IIO_04772 [Bacillus cereus VD115]PKR92779.1 hypothetical protein bcere0024_01230 [Bacillus cereus Rock4-18]PEJ62430.1 hypothetical protein CN906_20770 [Bacillus toyonensis]PEN67141.1 hypothetical protein CN545_18695 [Bacillus toyonensis]PGB31902.1 hypothetical protein COM16_17240 [Bacillus toyonensis]